MFARGDAGERGMYRECGVGRCRLLHLEQMGDGVLLYSTRNFVPCRVRHDGKFKKKKRKNMCVLVAGSLCCIKEIEGVL